METLWEKGLLLGKLLLRLKTGEDSIRILVKYLQKIYNKTQLHCSLAYVQRFWHSTLNFQSYCHLFLQFLGNTDMLNVFQQIDNNNGIPLSCKEIVIKFQLSGQNNLRIILSKKTQICNEKYHILYHLTLLTQNLMWLYLRWCNYRYQRPWL